VHHEAQIDWLAAHKTEQPQRVFLKLNSGMNRLGFTPQGFRAAWARLSALPQVDEVSLMTHFSDADGAGGVQAQLAVFERATDGLPGERTLANSAALLRHAAATAADWVRPGIMVYGAAPDHPQHTAAQWQLQPTMTLRSRIIGEQHLRGGDTVGYGNTFVAQQPLRIGVVACGYADGYPRHAPSGTPVLVDGRRTHTVGRVSMDMITVDLSALPDAGVGAEVTLWGQGPHGGVLPIDEVAHSAGTVGYELMCALAARVPVRVAR
jgi:alanine racemase